MGLRIIVSRLWAALTGRRREDDLRDEIQAHLDALTDDLMRGGMPVEQARAAARREFGGVEQVKETYRDQHGWPLLDALAQDLRYAGRALRKNPGFAAVAILTLALGIGANTAIFTLIDALLLRVLPVRDPSQLVQVIRMEGSVPRGENYSYPQVRAFAGETDVFAGVFGFDTVVFTEGPVDRMERARGAWVTGQYYDTLGLQPAAGRLLSPADDRRDAPPVAVITDQYWERKFASDPRAIGQTLLIEGVAVPIVGVSPRGFVGMDVSDVTDITIAAAARPQFPPRARTFLEAGATWLRVFARPRTGVSPEQAQARLRVVWSRLAAESAVASGPPVVSRRVAGLRLDVVPGGTGWTGLRADFRQPLFVLMIGVGLVLLISCANVANLLLARATARQREMAVRLALGAGRGRIVRQLLIESALLSAIGAVIGVAIAWWASRGLVELLSSGQAQAILIDLRPNWHVLAFTSFMALGTSLVFGSVPAFRATTTTPALALGSSSARIVGSRGTLASSLVSAQVALSLVLLVGAGLFVRTLHNLRTLDAGFQHQGVLIVRVDGPRAGYSRIALPGFYRELSQRTQQLPGVTSASFSVIAPPSGGGGVSQAPLVNGQPIGPEEIHFNGVSPRYFETMNTPILVGRDFGDRDDASAPGAAIVNQAFANRYLAGVPPLGQRVSLPGPGGVPFEMTIVGVVKDAVYETLRQDVPPTLFAPFAQRSAGSVTFEIQATGALAPVAALVRSEFQSRLPGMFVEVRTLTSQVERTLVRERLLATLATGLGLAALLLASIGVYGLLAYTVARRTNEIGVRMALGATRGRVVSLVVGDAGRLVAFGTLAGVPAAWGASRLVSSMLFGLTPSDPSTLAGAAVILGASAIVASVVPARRAVNVDPMVALRHE